MLVLHIQRFDAAKYEPPSVEFLCLLRQMPQSNNFYFVISWCWSIIAEGIVTIFDYCVAQTVSHFSVLETYWPESLVTWICWCA